MVYAIASTNASESSRCSAELEQLLVEDREKLITAVDTILNPATIQTLPGLMSQSVLPGVDDQSLEATIASASRSISLLVDDNFDPNRETLAALTESLNGRPTLQDQHVIEFARTILADPGFVDSIHAIVGLSETPLRENGSKTVLSALLSSASSILQRTDTATSCEGVPVDGSIEKLLSTEGFTDIPQLGSAAWVARVNPSGSSRVRTNPVTGSLYAPFVDGDSDGFADHNEAGEPITSEGQAIQIPPFGFGEGYDENRKRLSEDGSPLYDYYDAKQTALGHSTRLAGEALAAGLLGHTSSILNAVMGGVVDCAGEDCQHYESQGNPAFQMLFTILEVAQYDKPIVFLETWSTLLRNNPEVAEDALVSVGQIVNAVGDSSLSGTSPELYELIGELLPLVGQIFRIQTSSTTRMPRLLMGLVSDLGADARSFPQQLLSTIEYTTLLKENECSADPPDPNSPRVDYSRPRYHVVNGNTTVDNRSSIEKSLEILSTADCGSVPFTGGKTVTHTIIDLMSRLSPDTVCNLIDDLLGLLGVSGSVGEAVVNSALFVTGCTSSDDIRAEDLFALDDLAKSGALNFYLPVAKTFRQEGELRALVTVFETLGSDLRKDEDQSANTSSAVRPILPVLAEILRSGAMDSIFDLNEILVTVPATDGDGSLADVLVDSGARLLDNTTTVNTVSGPQNGVSLASELIDAFRNSAERIRVADQSESLSRTANFVSSYFTRTEEREGKLRLIDQSVVPQLASGLEALLEASRLPPSQYQCVLQEWQDESRQWIEDPAIADILGVGVVLRDYEQSAQIDLFLSRLLDPSPPHITEGPTSSDELVRMMAELLQSPTENEGADAYLRFAGALLDPEREAENLLSGIDKLLYRDGERVLIQLLQDSLGVRGSDKEQAPALVVIDLAQRYYELQSSNQCALSIDTTISQEELEDSLNSLVAILQDDDSILAFVFDLLRKRSGP